MSYDVKGKGHQLCIHAHTHALFSYIYIYLCCMPHFYFHFISEMMLKKQLNYIFTV